jgi:hypothetical protein
LFARLQVDRVQRVHTHKQRKKSEEAKKFYNKKMGNKTDSDKLLIFVALVTADTTDLFLGGIDLIFKNF